MNSLKLAETIQISINIKKQKPIWIIKTKKSIKIIDPAWKIRIQKWLEKQEIRQMESDKKREEQKLEMLKLKQQSDMLLFGMLNNLTNCLNSLHGRSNNN